MIWIARAVCIPQVGTIFQQILGAFFALVSSANFLHVHSTKHVWCVTPHCSTYYCPFAEMLRQLPAILGLNVRLPAAYSPLATCHSSLATLGPIATGHILI